MGAGTTLNDALLRSVGRWSRIAAPCLSLRFPRAVVPNRAMHFPSSWHRQLPSWAQQVQVGTVLS